MDKPLTTESMEPLTEDLPTNLPLSTMSQPNKPFASTGEHRSGLTDIVARPAIGDMRTRSLPSDLPPNGFVASRVNNINMSSTRARSIHPVNTSNHRIKRQDDRETLPSQSRSFSIPPFSRYRPGARMVHVPRLVPRFTEGDTALPSDPFVTEGTSHRIVTDPDAGTANNKGIVENGSLNSALLRDVGDSAATTLPFYRGHRRNQKGILHMKELGVQDDSRKGSSCGTNVLPEMDGQAVDGPTGPRYTPSSNIDYNLNGISSERVIDTRAVERKPLPASRGSSLTAVSSSRNEPNALALSPTATPEEQNEHEHDTPGRSSSSDPTIASEPWNVFDPERSFPKEAPPIAERLQRPLRRVERFKHVEESKSHTNIFTPITSLFEIEHTEVRLMYPLDTFVLAGAEHRCTVIDWACPWPPEKPAKKLLRFASRADFAPSVHYKSDSDGSPDSKASSRGTIDMGEHSSESRKSTFHVVNVPDEVQDDGLTLLAPRTYNPNGGEETTTLLPSTYNPAADTKITTLFPRTYSPTVKDDITTLHPLTYNAAADHKTANLLPTTYGATANKDTMTLLPLTYSATPGDVNDKSASFIRKPIPRDDDDKPRRNSTPSSTSQNEDEDGIDGYKGARTRCRVAVSPRAAPKSYLHHSPANSDTEPEQITVEKRHMRGDSTGCVERVSQSVGKFVVSHSDADVVRRQRQTPSPPIAHGTIPKEDTGILHRDFQFPSPDQNKRGVSMPLFSSSSSPSTKRGHGMRHTRHSSFGKLLNVFGRKDKEVEEAKTKDKRKESRDRRISTSVKKRLSSLWPR